MLKYNLISPKGMFLEGEAVEIKVLGSEGEFTVLTDHMDIITAIKAGKIGIKSNDKFVYYASSEGMFQLNNNTVYILAKEFNNIS